MSDHRKGSISLSEALNGGKKRKVFRNGTTTTTTTTTSTTTTTTTHHHHHTMTSGPEAPNNRTRITPEAAANYIQQATEAIAASTSALAAASRSVNENVKITLGPSLDGVTGADLANNLNNHSKGNSSSASSSAVSFGNLDLAYFTAAAASRNAKRPSSGTNPGSGGRKNDKDGLPCSEAEMKALMSMFVEIMGMSMDTDKLGKSSKKKNLGLLDAGWKWPADGMIPKEWDVLPPSYEDDDDDEDSLPDLDEVNDICRNQPSKLPSTLSSSATTPASHTQTSGSSGIAPVEWESLEQVAIEDAMEAEERARKAAKRREKKNRKKEKAKKEAAAKAAEAAQKKREKAILSWRSRVVSACQSNEVAKLEALLSESPLRLKEEGESITPHLEFLLPNIVAKNRQQAERGRESRAILANYIFHTSLPVVFTPLRTGRSALHTACFYGEHDFVRQVIGEATSTFEPDLLPPNYLNVTCQDSGWSPLHYAVVSGSNDIMETLLAGGCDIKIRTNDTHTWRSNNGKGITARELAESVVAGNHDKIMETHGIALQEVTSHFLSHTEERRKFIKLLERIVERLKDVEQNGYTPRNKEVTKEEEEIGEDSEINHQNSIVSNESNSRKKKKKKKKQQQQHQQQPEATVANNVNTTDDSTAATNNNKDPLISALMGMGFTEEQIQAAAKACGGFDRATADDLVAWIFAEESGKHEIENSPSDQTPPVTEESNAVGNVDKSKNDAEDARAKEEKRLEEAAKREEEARLTAQRLAAKREETRRRNREWNNRTQARQREEEQARLAELRARAAASAQVQRTQSNNSGGLNAPPASFFPVAQSNNSAAPVATTAATAHYSQGKLPAQPTSSTGGDGQLKNGSKQTGKSDNISKVSHEKAKSKQNMVQQQSKPAPVYHDMGAQYSQVGDVASQYPAVTDSIPQAFHPMPDVSSQGYLSLGDMTSQGYPSMNDVAAHGYPPMVDSATQGFPQMTEMMPQGYGQMQDASSQGFSQICTDDSTVSSLGSGMGKVAQPNVNSSIPPGFRPSSTLPPQSEESTFEVNENPLGEMRATAREFVPSKFTSSVASANSGNGSLGNASHFNSTTSLNSSAPVDQSGNKTRLRSFSDAGLMSNPVSMQMPGSTIPAAGVSSSFAPSSLLTTAAPHSMAFDRLAAVTSSSDKSPVPPSAASSVTGATTLAEESLIPAPLAANVLDTISSSGLAATSSFENGQTGTATNAASVASAASAVGGSSIWGDLNQNGSTATNNTNNTTGLSFMGLPSFSSKDGGLLNNHQSGSVGSGILGATMEKSGIGSGWGGSGIIGNGTSAGGSIW